jgi:topoisomerase-4 subunit A
VIYKDGSYEMTDLELTQRFDAEKISVIEKFNPEKIITAVYADTDKKQYFVKRFKIETTTLHNKFFFIKEEKNIVLETATTSKDPVLYFEKGRGAQTQKIKYKIGKNIEVTGWKTVGTRFEDYSKSVKMHWVESGDNAQQSLFE